MIRASAALAVAMMCHVHVPRKLEIYHPVTAVWTGTIGTRPVTCCLATAVLPGPVDDRIIGRCQVEHFRGRRRLGVSNHNSVIEGTICGQAHATCCKLNATAFPIMSYLPTGMVGSYECPRETGTFTLTQTESTAGERASESGPRPVARVLELSALGAEQRRPRSN